MSDQERRSAAARALDALVEEAREHLDVPEAPSVNDWSRLEVRLLAALEEDASASARLRLLEVRARRRRVAGVAFAFAAAAGVFLVARDPGPPATGARVEAAREPASALRATQPLAEPVVGGRVASEVRVSGVIASPGYVVRAGDVVEVTGTRAIFEQARKVTWLLEQEPAGGKARARVTAAGQPLVVGLDHGVVEAQVAPVSEGEAFAVDVATGRGLVRVAVHGTHLRVARAGDHVVVDLSEGEIAIGVPPREGVTTGTVVRAPAHVELDATDLASLRVDSTPDAVRAPVPLPVEGLVVAQRPESPAPPPHPVAPATALVTAKSGAPRGPDVAPPAPAPSPVAPSSTPSPREVIARAVRDCAKRHARPSDVRVTVTSDLRLRVSPTGAVESAQFTPPLMPEIQSCAAHVIYKTKLGETGTVTIPIEYSY